MQADKLLRYATPRSIQVVRYDGTILRPADPQLGVDAADEGFQLNRRDYCKSLLDAALEAGVNVKYNQEVISIKDTCKPSVETSDGSKHEADLILAADGVRSKIRAQLFPDIGPIKSWRPMHSFTLTPEQIRTHQSTAKFIDQTQSGAFVAQLWIGPGRFSYMSPIEKGKAFSVQVEAQVNEEDTDQNYDALEGEQVTKVDLDSLHQISEKFGQAMQDMTAQAGQVYKWAISLVPTLSQYSSPGGCIWLLGDAAHGMPVCLLL